MMRVDETDQLHAHGRAQDFSHYQVYSRRAIPSLSATKPTGRAGCRGLGDANLPPWTRPYRSLAYQYRRARLNCQGTCMHAMCERTCAHGASACRCTSVTQRNASTGEPWIDGCEGVAVACHDDTQISTGLRDMDTGNKGALHDCHELGRYIAGCQLYQRNPPPSFHARQFKRPARPPR